MIYVPQEYQNYKYLVSYGDNYIVLTDTSSVTADWTNPRDIDTIIQYFDPSIYTLESSLTVSSNRTFERVSTSDDFYLRGDCLSIVCSQFYVLLFVVFLINAMTRLFKKGGIFFGS